MIEAKQNVIISRFVRVFFSVTLMLTALSCGMIGTSTVEDAEAVGEDAIEVDSIAPQFYRIIDGDTIALHTITNDAGMRVNITNYGAHIVSIKVPDRKGEMRDVILGADSVEAYMDAPMSPIGAIMGSYAGPLKERKSEKSRDWMNRVFKVAKATRKSLTLTLQADSAAEGEPGSVAAQIDYQLTDSNSLAVTITAIVEKPTHLDIAQRLYFNLDGTTGKGELTSILDHQLTTKTTQYLHQDSTGNVSGDMLMTIWTPFSFKNPRSLRNVVLADFEPVRFTKGMDIYLVMPTYGESMEDMLSLYSPASGIKMEMSSSYPGVRVYTTNKFDGKLTGKDGKKYARRCAVVLMPHYYPNAPEFPGWGMDAPLKPGEVMREKVVYKFSAK